MSATIDEVRAVTGFDRTIISGEDMVSLESRAKKELQADVGSQVDFSDVTADTALFWLLCLFAKIHTGEIGAGEYSVGELESRSLDRESNIWLSSYRQRRDQLRGTQGVVFGHVASARSDREYGSN